MLSDVLQKLAKIVGDENVLSSPADLYAYGFDASIHHAMPDVVLKVSNSNQVEKIVKLAYEAVSYTHLTLPTKA